MYNLLPRRTFVIGGNTIKFIGNKHPEFINKKHPEFGKKKNPTLEDYLRNVIQNTLKITGVSASKIDKCWIGNFASELFCQQAHLGSAVVGVEPSLKFKPITRVEAACASGGLAFSSAVESIQAQSADVCLVLGIEVQNTVTAREGADYLARAAHYRRQRILDDFTFPALFAMRVKAYLSKFPKYTIEDLAHFSVKAYNNANKNPLAHMHHVHMPFELASQPSDENPNFLSNQELAPYLRTSDCSQVSDGASGIIVVSEKGLKEIGKNFQDAIELLTVQHVTGDLFEDSDQTQLETTKIAAEKAYKATSLKPSDIEVAEVHDCFTIAELQMYEALGFAPYGKGIDFLKEGHTQIQGKIPVNTGGGLIGFGHPVGATGVKQILEIFRQMKNQCGEYQISKIPTFGLTANMGGNDKTSIISIFKNLS